MLITYLQTQYSKRGNLYQVICLCFFITFLFLPTKLFSQKNYFQQHVDYKIKVTLDDNEHFLNGDITIRYTNNSPDTLSFIWMHLWPNAYANRNTALSRQLLEDGNGKLYFAKKDDQGFIDKIDFKVNGEKAAFIADSIHNDIVRLNLSQLLLPGGTIEIATPFRVKIPDNKISRLGHKGQAYQVSHWYPKPAV